MIQKTYSHFIKNDINRYCNDITDKSPVKNYSKTFSNI